jgi:hypothetical protein
MSERQIDTMEYDSAETTELEHFNFYFIYIHRL